MSDFLQDAWTTASIQEIAATSPRAIAIGPFGSRLKADLYVEEGFPIVRGQDIGPGKRLLDDNLVYVPDAIAESLSSCIVTEGDLIFPHRGAIGQVGIVGERPFLLSSSMMKLTCNRNVIDPGYLFYYFRGPGRDELLTRASTVGTPGIGQPLKSLRGIPIRFPNLRQQRAIAEVLGALDDKIAANSRLANRSFHLADSLFASAVSRADAYASLSEVAITVLGGTPSRDVAEYWTGGTVPWLNSGKANEDRIVSPSEYITETALAKSAAKLMPAGATLIAITGATLGQVARLEIPASGNQSLVGIWSEDSKMTDWLHFAVRTQIPELLKRATGAAQQHVNKRDVDSLQVPLVSAVELGSFSRRASPLLELAAVADRENESLAATRDALLPQLMSGKLRVKDAEQLVEKVA